MKLTVLYDGQFWVGVVEIEHVDGTMTVHRHIFGTEPKDVEVWAFVNRELLQMVNAPTDGAAFDARAIAVRRVNPKRALRLAARETQLRGISTKAQQAMKLQIETRKHERKQLYREQLEAEADRKWQLRREKAKAKHRGK